MQRMGLLHKLNVHFRLIKHTEKLLEEKEEQLCVKILRTLREMMSSETESSEKVSNCPAETSYYRFLKIKLNFFIDRDLFYVMLF